MNEETRARIKGYLEGFIDGLLQEIVKTGVDPRGPRPSSPINADGNYKPFHEALLPEGILRSLEFERKFSTRLGSSFEEAARLIALGAQGNARRGYRLAGTVTKGQFDEIENIVNDLRETGKPRDFVKLTKQVSRTLRPSEPVELAVTVDLFVQIKKKHYYFEIKSPKPNKGQCLEVLERFLRVHAILKNAERTATYYAMPYNPYGEKRSDYKHWVSRHIDMEKMVLIGAEFWNLIGGENAYSDLLSIYVEVGKEKGPDIVDKLLTDY